MCLTNGNRPNTHPVLGRVGNETFSSELPSEQVYRRVQRNTKVEQKRDEENVAVVIAFSTLAYFVWHWNALDLVCSFTLHILFCLLSLAHTHSPTRTAPKECESRREPQRHARQAGRKDRRAAHISRRKGRAATGPTPTNTPTNQRTHNKRTLLWPVREK